MAPAPNLTSSTHIHTHALMHAVGWEQLAGGGKKVLNRKKRGRERKLVVLMEVDIPSFSHLQLPSSFLLPTKSSD